MTSKLVAPQLISMPEIAELTGVRRPVVTTWRRRHTDFPPPIGGSRNKPLFDAAHVIDWLVHTGRAQRERIELDLRLHLLTNLTGEPGAALGLTGRRRGSTLTRHELVGGITALICLRHIDDEPLCPDHRAERHVIAELRDRAADVDPDDELLRREIEAMPGDSCWLAAAIDDLIEAAWDCRRAYERVLAARRRLGVPELYADEVMPTLATLMAGLSGASEQADAHGRVTIADRYAGVGDLLMTVHRQLPESSDIRALAAEPDPFMARMLRRRLAVHDVASPERRIHIADDLPATGPAPDATVTCLPYRSWETRHTSDSLTAVQRIADLLAPGQTAVVLGPADLLVGALAPYHPSAAARRALLESGRAEAIIRLPGGVMPFRPAYQTALWVLRHEEPSPWRGRVLLADVSDQPLTAELAETLVWDIATWRRNGHEPTEHLRAHGCQVEVTELTVHRRPLTARRPEPLRHRLKDPGDTVARMSDVEIELERHTHPTATPRRSVRADLAVVDSPRRPPSESIATLLRRGLLAVAKGHRIAGAHVSPEGHHPLLGAAELLDAARIGARTVDRAVFASVYQRATLTDPGDVVVCLGRRLGVQLDESGFAVVEFPARVLRITSAGREHFTPRVLAALLTAAPHAMRAPRAVRATNRLADLPLPILPPAEVTRLDALLAAADDRRAVARNEIKLLDELCRAALSGVAEGTLTLGDPSSWSTDRT